MASYWKCIESDWKTAIHDDPMVVEACERIIAAGEPCPVVGKTYRSTGTYNKANGYKGLLFDEFDWTEYEILCSDDEIRSPNVFWNQAKFELIEDKFEPNKYVSWGKDGEFSHVEEMTMVVEFEFNTENNDDKRDDNGEDDTNTEYYFRDPD